MFFCFFLTATVLFSFPEFSDAQLADGTYEMNYTVLQGDSDSVSMANDYFDKPATVTIGNGATNVQLQLNHSAWITNFQVGNTITLVSSNTDLDTRVVSFAVSGISDPIASTIKVYIDNESLNYHHEYSIRLKFDESSAVLISEEESTAGIHDISNETSGSTTNNSSSNSKEETTTIQNPKTGANQSMILYSLICFIGIVGFCIIAVRSKIGREGHK